MGISTAIEQARYHAWFQHNGADGFITVAKKTNSGKFKQYHYRADELASQLSTWLGEDVYFSQNTFYKPYRSIETIRQLRSLYIDLDFYLFNYDPSWVFGKLEHEYFKESIPEPNIIIFSGQGMVLIWLLEPVPYKALPLWQSVQKYLLDTLAELGGDPKAADAARVFRIAGSINSKNGVEVRAEYRHDHKYELRQIQRDYLPELEEAIDPPKVKKKGRKKKTVQLFNTYRLHYARLMDLVKLVELRNYEVTGHRELICFLYRYWLCCYSQDLVEALNQTKLLNSQFTKPLSVKEVERATKSAEKAYEARSDAKANEVAISKGYPGAGYNVTNKKLIDWLDISSDEMKHMGTIISTNEKRRRKAIANKELRRKQGVIERSEYLKQQKEQTIDKLWQVQQVMQRHPKAKKKEWAEMLGISDRHLRRLIKQL